MKKALLLLLPVLLSACSSSPEPATSADTITANDFEGFAGWVPQNGSLNTEQAHSGKHSIKVDQNQEFSMGYTTLLGKASTRKPHKLKLECWAYLPSNKGSARYEVQIVDPVTGQKVFEDGIPLAEQVNTYNTWKQVSKEITLPDNVAYTNEMRIFLWRADASEPAYIDDMQLTVVE